jgi:ArsR family transcriptional regulator
MATKTGAPSHSGLVAVYQCLSDETRLRILNLLMRGQLCVRDFQELLGRPQVFISKHLAYLRKQGLVQADRFEKWMIYRLPKRMSRDLEENLRCLRECARRHEVFKADLARLRVFAKRTEWVWEEFGKAANRTRARSSRVRCSGVTEP